jgi:hypothetical protein
MKIFIPVVVFWTGKKKVSSFFLYILTRVPQASGFNYANEIGNKSSFITTELYQLAVYGER